MILFPQAGDGTALPRLRVILPLPHPPKVVLPSPTESGTAPQQAEGFTAPSFKPRL